MARCLAFSWWLAFAVASAVTASGCATPSEAQRATPIAASNTSTDPLATTTPVERMVLPNGLTVLLDPDHRAPLVAVRVVYRVGWADDPPDRAGLAHLTEHLLFHGSKRVADGMHFRLLHESGADFVNGSTATGRTDFWALVPSNELALALWLESDRMGTGLEAVSPARLELERRIIVRERAERIENVPNGRVRELVADKMFPAGHPFRAPLVAGPNLERATLDEVRNFHRAHHVPGNALLVLSGDFVSDNAKALVRHYFAPIAARPAPPAPAPAPGLPPAVSASLELEARIDTPSLLVSWPSAPVFESGDAELDVVASYLNRIGLRRFIHDTPILSRAHAQQESEVHASTFRIGTDLRPGASPDAALAAIDAVIDGIRQRGLEQADIRQYVYGWLFDVQAARDDLLERSWAIAHSEFLLADPDFMSRAIKRYRAVTTATVRETVLRYLQNDRRVIAVVKPNRQAPLAGQLVKGP